MPTRSRLSAETAPESLPSGWRVTHRGSRRIGYGYGSHVTLEIEPRFTTRWAHRNREPSEFRVTLRKRFYAHELVGDPVPLGSADAFDEAREIAQEYMAEFVRDRQAVAMDTRAELEADPVMAEDAEEAIVTEAAADAAVEVAGYSDELLLSELRGLLESENGDRSVLQAVVHREATSYDPVFVSGERPAWDRDSSLREFYRQFEWLNEGKLARSLDIGELSFMTASFDDARLLRYLAEGDVETAVLIDPNHPIHLPPFERQIAELVTAKWEA